MSILTLSNYKGGYIFIANIRIKANKIQYSRNFKINIKANANIALISQPGQYED